MTIIETTLANQSFFFEMDLLEKVPAGEIPIPYNVYIHYFWSFLKVLREDCQRKEKGQNQESKGKRI
jgi:hypothetical protein